MRQSVPCSAATPCHQHRHCDYCARLRQRYIAELVSNRHGSGSFTFATFTHLSGPGLAAARQLKPGTGGLWSVEAGSKMGGMHVNLLFESQIPLLADDLAASAMIAGADVWAKAVPATDLRNIAAYINKREGMPHKVDYGGNLYGTWGSWRSVRQVAQQQRLSPLLAGASLADDFRRLEITGAPELPLGLPENKPSRPADLTRDQYRALAVDKLALLRQVLDR